MTNRIYNNLEISSNGTVNNKFLILMLESLQITFIFENNKKSDDGSTSIEYLRPEAV